MRHFLARGKISESAAGLCYSVILALLSITYVTLGCFELALVFRWGLGRKGLQLDN